MYQLGIMALMLLLYFILLHRGPLESALKCLF